MQNLRTHLEKNIYNLKGEWVKKNSSYDKYICDILDMTEDTCRYWDAIWNSYFIEFKKGKSIWLDLVRFSEEILKINSNAEKHTITLFFIPNKEKNEILKIIGVKTSKIIKKLKLNEENAIFFIMSNENLPRSFNAQASLTIKDISEIADFIILKENS